ncbi:MULTISPECIES: ABC transporter ATP-binding protein [Schaalia]|uniref:ABC transporter ATP-binding protein n=1 Tax=Schaalia TaxID=2529408 RepID=UPI0026E97147|nr:ABC transporter ATP-binding protein [Schaalia hyovaginalis]MCI6411266.1 ABC transporter ATP-binding protein [Schaalia hyovaginalis]MCI7512994.1 ABC transporter ATP-binding protein [Schaalia hyovaginalis]MDY4491585.1 ABC transporter ATP-binding protein [Schaalia hyovaginalis]
MAGNLDQNDEPKRGIEVSLGEPSVVVDHVHQVYRTETTDKAARKGASAVARAMNRLFRWPIKVDVHAVNDVSLVVRSGESVGILGLNGSGKSTLLRMIAGVEPPMAGRVLARSQPTLLGVGAALVPDLTGIRNIRLGCLAMGLTLEETKAATPAIVELAGIGDSIYRPMKTYSSGMGARLRFAINAASQPDILLIDEALGTGDASFKKRSEDVLAEIRRAAGTVFLVSHAAQTVEEMCTRAVWMHEGRLIADGPAWETARAYRLWAWRIAEGKTEEADRLLAEAKEKYAPQSFELLEGGTRKAFPIHVAH